MGFKIHKLRLETLGEYLVSVRESFGYTLEEAASACGILPKYLEDLEAGEYGGLPETVYVVGFLKKLARFYRTGEVELITQYKRELTASKKRAEVGGSSWKNYVNISWVPRRWAMVLVLGAFVVAVGLIGYQIAGIAMVPKLKLLSPTEGQSVDSGVVEVFGETTPGSEVSVNNQLIYAGEDGKFAVTVGVLSGAQTLSVTSRNRFGKASTKHINFVVSGSSDTGFVGPSLPPVVLGIKTDVGVMASVLLKGVMRPVSQGEAEYKYFASNNTILLSTSDAGKTRVVLNGRELGLLGEQGLELRNIPFTNVTYGNYNQDKKLSKK